MNRAARRKAASEERKRHRRREWSDGILHFHNVARGALLTYVVGVDEYPVLLAGAADGDPTATALARAVAQWIHKAVEPGSDFLCLDCDQPFGPNVAAPAAFAVTLPFANLDCALVTGVCTSCIDSGKDLQAAALRRLRGIWPDAFSVKPGAMQ